MHGSGSGEDFCRVQGLKHTGQFKGLVHTKSCARALVKTTLSDISLCLGVFHHEQPGARDQSSKEILEAAKKAYHCNCNIQRLALQCKFDRGRFKFEGKDYNWKPTARESLSLD